MKKIEKMFLSALVAVSLVGCSSSSTYTAGTYTAEADGYGGVVTVEITTDSSSIKEIVITGDKETPTVGGAALEELTNQVKEAQSADIDGVSGATYTSNAVKEATEIAIAEAKGEEIKKEDNEKEVSEVEATGLSQGLGVLASGRLGPGSDDQDVGIYSVNEVIAYVLFDDDGKILDLQIDMLEFATPNYDGEYMPKLTGFPGQSYNADEDHDEKVDSVLTQDEDSFLEQVESWKTKRERGTTYKLNSGTWAEEMDIFQDTFKGSTVEEVEEWYEKYCSDVNGRPLNDSSENEEDIKKYEALSDEEKEELDAISGATISLNDAHGNIIGAIKKAWENRVSVKAESVSKIGLGVTNIGRVGPGEDNEEVGIYCINTTIVGACYDEDGNVIDSYADIMEVATPNYDGEHMPKFTGFPGQSYNADEDHDEKVDTVLKQTENSFIEQIESWKTKRERSDTYKLDSGTWADEMDIFQDTFKGLTSDEIEEWYETYCSDVNGRPLHGTSENEDDIEKYDALTDEEKEGLDAISGATISLNDAHGDIIGAFKKSWDNAVETKITIS